MTRDELLQLLEVERHAIPTPPPRPSEPEPDRARRRRILLGLENPDDVIPHTPPEPIDADVMRMSTDLRWSPKQIAASLNVDIRTVYAVLNKHMNKESAK